MTGMSKKIFAGAGITSNQQRCAQRRQLARLFYDVFHFGADGNNLAKRTEILRCHILQLTSHSDGGAQHHHRAGQHLLLIFALQMDRRNFHQEILPVNHDMFAMRILRIAFQPALKVKPID